ncbi:MAG: hypothetical protein AB9835_03210 [Eubacteriales bacterium]
MNDDIVFCLALNKNIPDGLCWEYCFATLDGPIDAEYSLSKLIKNSNEYSSIADFHKVCHKCRNCKWS